MTENILITGTTGFIGAHLADYLTQDKDVKVHGLFRTLKDESTFKALKLDENKNVNLRLGNINMISDVEDIIVQYDIDKIYHLAAKVIVSESAKAPLVTYITNVIGTLNVLEIVRMMKLHNDKEIPTLIMSSDKAYGESEILPYTENLPLNGLDVYSSSKSMEDILSRAYSYNYNLPITVVRPCNIYGGCDFNWSRIVPSLANACLNPLNFKDGRRKLLLNKGSYNQKREYLYVKDLVKIQKLLMDNIEQTRNNAYNITSDTMYSTKEFVNTFLKTAECIDNTDIYFKEKEKYFKEIENQYLDDSKLIEVVGNSLEKFTDINDGLKQTINDYKTWFEDKKEYYDELELIKKNLNEQFNVGN